MPALICAAAGLLAACGSYGDDPAAASTNATAVSANPAQDPAPGPKGVTSKVDPRVRPGVEAPLDTTPEASVPVESIGARPIAAAQRFATGFEAGVALTEASGDQQCDRQLVGSDTAGYALPLDLWSTPAHGRSQVQSTIGKPGPAPATDFLAASIKPVMNRQGSLTQALSLHSKAIASASQRIAVQNADMAVEPVVFQRVWIKFDEAMLARAQSLGSSFYQTFWEATAQPDYRLLLKVRYDPVAGFYWQAKADLMDGGAPAWETELRTVPVVLAPPLSAAGWHKVEIWLDRPAGRFKVAIDGVTLVDRTGALTGASGNRIDRFRMMMFESSVAPLGEVLFDDLELWDAPPGDAWGG